MAMCGTDGTPLLRHLEPPRLPSGTAACPTLCQAYLALRRASAHQILLKLPRARLISQPHVDILAHPDASGTDFWLPGIFGCRAQWDPLQAVLAASTPASERGWLDPFGDILKSSKGVRAADSKYNPLPGLFAAEAPARGGSDLVGDIIRGLINLDLRGTPGLPTKLASIELE